MGDVLDVPSAIVEKAKNITLDLLPVKSRMQYEKEYDLFNDWKKRNAVKTVNEDVMLAYLGEKVRVVFICMLLI